MKYWKVTKNCEQLFGKTEGGKLYYGTISPAKNGRWQAVRAIPYQGYLEFNTKVEAMEYVSGEKMSIEEVLEAVLP